MRRKANFYLLIGAIFLAFAGLWYSVDPSSGQDEIQGDILRGGKLYISWDKVLGTNLPDRNQPIWKEVAPDQEYDPRSWRCVTCHGWDYRGSEGSTSRAIVKHAGFPGLFGMVAEPQTEIIKWIDGTRNSGHDFSQYLAEQDLLDLSAFLSSGLVAPELIADPETKLVQGTPTTGETIYQEFCFSCHGIDGAKINFGGAAAPNYLGDMSLQNPWRVAHTIRFGHLGIAMPPAEQVDLGFSQQIDLITYTQSLPQATIIGSEEYPVIEYDSQSSTEILAYLALGLGFVILGGTAWVLNRHRLIRKP